MHEIVSQEQPLKEGHIGDPIVGRDFSQGIVVEQFANVLLDRGVRSRRTSTLARDGLEGWSPERGRHICCP